MAALVNNLDNDAVPGIRKRPMSISEESFAAYPMHTAHLLLGPRTHRTCRTSGRGGRAARPFRAICPC